MHIFEAPSTFSPKLRDFNGENGFMAEKTELNGRARYYYGKEQDFTGKTEFYGRAGFYGSERDFTGENGISRERTVFHGR